MDIRDISYNLCKISRPWRSACHEKFCDTCSLWHGAYVVEMTLRGQRRGVESNRHAIKSMLARRPWRLQIVAFWFTEASDEEVLLESMGGLTWLVPLDLTIRPRVLSDAEMARLGNQASGTTHRTKSLRRKCLVKARPIINGGSLTRSVVLEKNRRTGRDHINRQLPCPMDHRALELHRIP